MILEWCKDCKNNASKGYINTKCLACKWEYVGQEAFDYKSDLFEGKNILAVRTERFFGNALELVVCEII